MTSYQTLRLVEEVEILRGRATRLRYTYIACLLQRLVVKA